ncbi:hypothetical protein AMECASPLE_039143 [Ameca splendens]|uniref:Uncharacterized protein n=1 Tax=Ameca splendens TaxID=208324 RepID=A0ABV0YJG2_9TELE
MSSCSFFFSLKSPRCPRDVSLSLNVSGCHLWISPRCYFMLDVLQMFLCLLGSPNNYLLVSGCLSVVSHVSGCSTDVSPSLNVLQMLFYVPGGLLGVLQMLMLILPIAGLAGETIVRTSGAVSVYRIEPGPHLDPGCSEPPHVNVWLCHGLRTRFKSRFCTELSSPFCFRLRSSSPLPPDSVHRVGPDPLRSMRTAVGVLFGSDPARAARYLTIIPEAGHCASAQLQQGGFRARV